MNYISNSSKISYIEDINDTYHCGICNKTEYSDDNPMVACDGPRNDNQ